MRYGKVFLFLGFMALSIIIGRVFADGPWVETRKQDKLNEHARRDLDKIESQRTDLIKTTSRYSSRQGEEELLRERGHFATNERPLFERGYEPASEKSD